MYVKDLMCVYTKMFRQFVCPHGTALGTSIYLPAYCQKATPEDINLPQGEIPEYPDLPPLDFVDDLGEPRVALTFDLCPIP